jgi:hypothetical protein
MFSRLDRADRWVRRLFRGMAVAFLLFACADICAPEMCAEEILGLPPAALAEAAAASERGDDPLPALVAADDSPERGSDPAHVEEDCFCCCSHLLVSAHFTIEPPPRERTATVPRSLSPPDAPACGFYRPPRAA